jgi:hypothetical protein
MHLIVKNNSATIVFPFKFSVGCVVSKGAVPISSPVTGTCNAYSSRVAAKLLRRLHNRTKIAILSRSLKKKRSCTFKTRGSLIEWFWTQAFWFRMHCQEYPPFMHFRRKTPSLYTGVLSKALNLLYQTTGSLGQATNRYAVSIYFFGDMPLWLLWRRLLGLVTSAAAGFAVTEISGIVGATLYNFFNRYIPLQTSLLTSTEYVTSWK